LGKEKKMNKKMKVEEGKQEEKIRTDKEPSN